MHILGWYSLPNAHTRVVYGRRYISGWCTAGGTYPVYIASLVYIPWFKPVYEAFLLPFLLFYTLLGLPVSLPNPSKSPIKPGITGNNGE